MNVYSCRMHIQHIHNNVVFSCLQLPGLSLLPQLHRGLPLAQPPSLLSSTMHPLLQYPCLQVSWSDTPAPIDALRMLRVMQLQILLLFRASDSSSSKCCDRSACLMTLIKKMRDSLTVYAPCMVLCRAAAVKASTAALLAVSGLSCPQVQTTVVQAACAVSNSR